MNGPIYIEYSLNIFIVCLPLVAKLKKDRLCDENGIYSSNIIDGYDMLSTSHW